jgi:hypothetical protein
MNSLTLRGQRMWAALFARLLPQAYQRLTSLQVPQ